jgi:hypothetical protein
MDADDSSLPTRIAEQVAFMDANPAVGISGTGFQSFGERNEVTLYEKSDNDIKLQMLFHCRFCHPTVIIRKQVLTDNNLLFSTGFPHAEDYELWARMAFVTNFANLQQVLLRYRVHANSVTFKHAAVQRQNSDRVIHYFFSKIGVNINLETIPLWVKFCYAGFDLSATEMQQIEALLVSLQQANKQSGYVAQHAMDNFLSQKWFNLCYNNVKNKAVQTIFNNSTISALLPFKSRLKFKIKAVL